MFKKLFLFSEYRTFLLFVLVFHCGICIDFDGWMNIEIFHKLKCKENELFCNRGSITLKSIRAGSPIIEQISFINSHIEELKELAANDDFYTIKTIVKSAEDSKGFEFLSSVKAQDFLDNGLSDLVNVWILPNGGVIAVNFQVTNNTLAWNKDSNDYKVNTNFLLHHIDQAPVPDTASYIQKLEREREAREKGEVKDNRSFLAKYWMYIVPVAIFVMISGATNPEGAGQPARQ